MCHGLKYNRSAVVAGAPPRTLLGECTALPRNGFGPFRGWTGIEGKGKERKKGERMAGNGMKPRESEEKGWDGKERKHSTVVCLAPSYKILDPPPRTFDIQDHRQTSFSGVGPAGMH